MSTEFCHLINSPIIAYPRGKLTFLDVHESYHELKSAIDLAITRILTSGQYIHGLELDSNEPEPLTNVRARVRKDYLERLAAYMVPAKVDLQVHDMYLARFKKLRK